MTLFICGTDAMLTLDKAEIMQSEYRNTFVYAVPRHCLNPRLRYNPYEIVTISQVSDSAPTCILMFGHSLINAHTDEGCAV